jgi:hypothetical protein
MLCRNDNKIHRLSVVILKKKSSLAIGIGHDEWIAMQVNLIVKEKKKK